MEATIKTAFRRIPLVLAAVGMLWHAGGAFGVVLVKDGKVLYTRAIGYSQISETEKKPLTTANRFRIGSITKMFTAVMILQLVEEGKLKLTDTLDKFLNEKRTPPSAQLIPCHTRNEFAGPNFEENRLELEYAFPGLGIS